MGEAAFLVHRQGNRSQYGKDGEPTSEKAKKKIKELREENEKLRIQVEYLKKLNAIQEASATSKIDIALGSGMALPTPGASGSFKTSRHNSVNV